MKKVRFSARLTFMGAAFHVQVGAQPPLPSLVDSDARVPTAVRHFRGPEKQISPWQHERFVALGQRTAAL